MNLAEHPSPLTHEVPRLWHIYYLAGKLPPKIGFMSYMSVSIWRLRFRARKNIVEPFSI